MQKRFIHAAAIAFTTVTPLVAQSAVLKSQDFDLGSSDPTYWSYSTLNGNISGGASSADDTPTSSRAISGKSYRFNYDGTTPSITSGTLTLNPVSVAGYKNLKLIIPVAAVSKGSAANGLDGGDTVSVDVQTGTTSATPTFNSADLVLSGNSNSRWSFAATGSAETTVGTLLNKTAPAGLGSGNGANTDGIAKLIIDIPDGTNFVSTQINLANNDNGELWILDGIQLTGTAVPEPASLSLLGLGAVALLKRRRTSGR